MIRKYIYLLVIISGFLTVFLTANAQPVSVSQLPYSCSFEDPAENAAWTLSNRPAVSTKWVFGEAAQRVGRWGMYVSDDNGASASYIENTPNGYCIVASREFSLPSGTYDLAFDWKVAGRQGDAFRVAWVPVSKNISSTSLGGVFWNSDIDPYAVGDVFFNSPSWHTSYFTVTVPAGNTENYKLVFVWKALGAGNPVNPGACIDHVQLGIAASATDCWRKPFGITAENSADDQGLDISWNGSTVAGVTYDLIYFLEGSSRPDTIQGINGTSVTIPYSNMSNGRYTFMVRIICPDGTSIWVYLSGVKVLDMSKITINPIACPGVTFDEDAFVEFENKYIRPKCKGIGKEYTIHPTISATGVSIAGYVALPILFDPPFEIGPDPRATKVFGGPGVPDDSWSAPFDLPFLFCFFESIYNQAIVGANGQITFDIDKPAYQPGTNPYIFNDQPNIPSTEFNPMLGGYGVMNSIFGVYEDIDPSKCTGIEGAYAGVMGEAPCRTFCVSFKDIPLFGNNSQKNSYQMVFYEGTNIIDVYVEHRACCSTTNQGVGIIGVINEDGSDGIAAPGRNVHDPQWTVTTDAQREGWRFVPISTPTYDITWYEGQGFDGRQLGKADTLAVDQVDGIEYVTLRMQYRSCNGEYVDVADTARIEWSPVDTVLVNNTTVKICEGESYINGYFNVSEEGYYTHILKNMYGCDSLLLALDLKIQKTSSKVDTVGICYGETYTYRGQDFTKSGVYTFIDRYSVTHCDSLRDTLYVNVIPPITFTIHKEDALMGPNTGSITVTDLPNGCYYTINGVLNAPTTNLSAGTYIIIAYDDEMGCQSMPQTIEIFSECLSVQVDYGIPDVCADSAEIKIPFTVTSGLTQEYSLIFDYKAKAAGFEDVLNFPITVSKNVLSYIDLKMPDTIIPGNYQVTVKFIDYGCSGEEEEIGTLDIVKFSILYPSSIVQQKWNDVLAVFNQDYNGGYSFSGFQWYENGVELTGETGSYYYLGGNGAVFNDTLNYYQIALRRVGETEYIISCPIRTIHHDEFAVSLRPTIVSFNQPVTILFGTRRLTIKIWDTMGNMRNTAALRGGNAQMLMPPQAGVYLVEMMDEDSGQRVMERVIVQ
ncbi:MAG: hypothetical protein LBB41_04310 [Prevotellaceae bacterium]|jgi:hypothetical protein|nr:hypothetical protein [Prevotellaceae bacterium]